MELFTRGCLYTLLTRETETVQLHQDLFENGTAQWFTENKAYIE